MEGLAPGSCSRPMSEKKTRPQEQLNCPRCSSTNTKFCYYNNYSLTQPRYYCKTCRRYWTEGGSLRNVPVGGGSRKNKKVITASTSSSSSTSLSPSSKIPDLNPPSLPHTASQNPKSHGGQDLNLAFPVMENYHGMPPHYVEVPKLENSHSVHHQNSCATSSSLSALELLRSGMASSGLNPYIPTLMPGSNTLYSSGFPPQELKPNLEFSVDHGIVSRYDVQENNGRHVFPFGEMKHQLSTSNEVQRKEQSNSIGYWNGMMGESSW